MKLSAILGSCKILAALKCLVFVHVDNVFLVGREQGAQCCLALDNLQLLSTARKQFCHLEYVLCVRTYLLSIASCCYHAQAIPLPGVCIYVCMCVCLCVYECTYVYQFALITSKQLCYLRMWVCMCVFLYRVQTCMEGENSVVHYLQVRCPRRHV